MLSQAQLDRGMRRLIFGWKGAPPSLPDFMRLCRSVGSDEFEDNTPSTPLPALDGWLGDAWDAAANRYLLGHLTKRLERRLSIPGRPASYDGMRGSTHKTADASPEFVANVQRLVAAKNSWASDMRDMAVNGEVPPETQQAVWHDYLGRAEQAA